jgi:hypothetical protein
MIKIYKILSLKFLIRLSRFALRQFSFAYGQLESIIFGRIEEISVYKNNDIKIIKIYPAENYYMPQLKDIEGNVHVKAYDCQVPEANIYVINNGFFIPGMEEVYDSKGRVLKEITVHKTNPQKKKSKRKFLNYKKIKGNVLCLSLSGLEENYYHFNVEYLARWHIFKLSGLSFDYVDFNIKNKFQRQFFDLLNIPKEKLISNKLEKSIITADALIVPSIINNWEFIKMGQDMIHHQKLQVPKWIKEVHEEFRKKSDATGRIYISRSKANRRKVTNEKEVIKLVTKYGFTKYDMEDLDINDQIKLFNKAQIIISAHGASLVNIVYCSNSFKLLEIYPQNYFDAGLRVLAMVLECDYHYLIGQCLNEHAISPQYEDLYIDCKKLRKWLNENANYKLV